MRCLALVAEAYGSSGGVARASRDMLAAFAKAGVFETIEVLPRLAAGPGDPPRGVVAHAARPRRAAYAAAAAGIAARLRPDLVYCGHVFMAPLAAALARAVGAKLAAHAHGLDVWSDLSAARRAGLRRADLVFCASQHTKARLLERVDLPADRAVVCWNTVRETFKPGDRQAARRLFGLANETVLLTVARLDARQRHKGHDRVIQALPGLSRPGRSLFYLVAGEGDDRARLERLAETDGVADGVRFLGAVAEADLPALYRAADVFAMPSTGEGFGIAFLEAMACGAPAIGLDVGGAPEALGAGGSYGVAAPAEDFPRALAALLDAPRPDPQRLHEAVSARFGRARFEARIAAALADLFAASLETEARRAS